MFEWINLLTVLPPDQAAALINGIASLAGQVERLASIKKEGSREKQVDALLQELGDQNTKILALLEDDAFRSEMDSYLSQLLNVEEIKRGYEMYMDAMHAFMVSQHNHMELLGADPHPQAHGLPLSMTYVGLTSRSQSGAAVHAWSRNDLIRVLSQPSARLILWGEAGEGKSTMMRWLAMRHIVRTDQAINPSTGVRSAVEGENWGNFQKDDESDFVFTTISNEYSLKFAEDEIGLYGRGRGSEEKLMKKIELARVVPILLKVRDLDMSALPKSPAGMIAAAGFMRTPPEGWGESLFESGCALLLIDGLDECPAASRKKMYRWLKNWMDSYSRCSFAFTSRPLATRPPFANRSVSQAHLEPLTRSGQHELISKWYSSFERRLRHQERWVEEYEGRAERLIEELDELPALRRVATNPLVCAMICALYCTRREKLPRFLIGLCKALCQMMLDRRDEASDVLSHPDWDDKFADYDRQRLPLARAVARKMVMRSGANSRISEEELRDTVARQLDNSTLPDKPDASVVAEQFILRGGIVRREGAAGQVAFIHNIFKAYLAGAAFVEEGAAGTVANLATEDEEVVVFASQHAGPEGTFNDELFRQLLDEERLRDMTRSARRRREYLALRCLSLDPYIKSPEIRQRLEKLRGQLLPPAQLREANIIAGFGESGESLVSLLNQPPSNVRQRAACVRALVGIGTPSALNAIKKYRNDSHLGVIRELARNEPALGIPAVQKMVQSPEGVPEALRDCVVELSPLATIQGLRNVSLRYCSEIRDLSPLARVEFLQNLNLSNCIGISDLTPLAQLENLETLNLTNCVGVMDLAPIAGLRRLRSLSLKGLNYLNLEAIATMTSLEQIVLDIGMSSGQLEPIQPLLRSGLEVEYRGRGSLSGFEYELRRR